MAEATPQERSMRVFGYITDAYRARCRLDGRLYCLRRVEGKQVSSRSKVLVCLTISHANVVRLQIGQRDGL